jgi:hypothetical protein
MGCYSAWKQSRTSTSNGPLAFKNIPNCAQEAGSFSHSESEMLVSVNNDETKFRRTKTNAE